MGALRAVFAELGTHMGSIRCAQAAGPGGAATQQHPAAAPIAPVPASNPAALSNEGAIDPNLLQNLLSQLQAPQQQAQVCTSQHMWGLSIRAHHVLP